MENLLSLTCVYSLGVINSPSNFLFNAVIDLTQRWIFTGIESSPRPLVSFEAWGMLVPSSLSTFIPLLRYS